MSIQPVDAQYFERAAEFPRHNMNHKETHLIHSQHRYIQEQRIQWHLLETQPLNLERKKRTRWFPSQIYYIWESSIDDEFCHSSRKVRNYFLYGWWRKGPIFQSHIKIYLKTIPRRINKPHRKASGEQIIDLLATLLPPPNWTECIIGMGLASWS